MRDIPDGLGLAWEGAYSADNNLGVMFARRGDWVEAEHWWRRAADSGIPGAMHNLAALFARLGNLAEAEHWWRRAADSGHAGAKHNLRVLLAARGETAEAEQSRASDKPPPGPPTGGQADSPVDPAH